MTTKKPNAGRTVPVPADKLQTLLDRLDRLEGAAGGGRDPQPGRVMPGHEPGGPVAVFTMKVDRLLRRQGKGRTDLAAGIGFSPSRISKWLGSDAKRPRGNPPVHVLCAIADYLGCSLRYLCDHTLQADPGKETSPQDAAYEEAYAAVRVLGDPALAKARLLGTADPAGVPDGTARARGHASITTRPPKPKKK